MIYVTASPKRLFAEGKTIYYINFVIWLGACVCACVCAAKIKGEAFSDTSAYIEETLCKNPDIWQSIKSGLWQNLKLFLLMTAPVLSAVFLPLPFLSLAFGAFSLGFTSTLLIRIYSFRGILLSLFGLALPTALELPFVFAMVTNAVCCHGKKSKSYAYQSSKSSHGRLLYVLKQALMTGIICIVTVCGCILSHFVLKLV